MSRVVIDASVALAWVLSDESSTYAESVLQSLEVTPAVVPAHWMLEFSNALLQAERRGRITTAEVTRSFEIIEGLPIMTDRRTGDSAGHQTLTLARTHRLTIYDAAYLELAIREGAPLATLDSELIAACKSAGCSVA